MKKQLKDLIVSNIEAWTDVDIYAISLFVYDDCDNPSRPTVTLGYNTESQVSAELSSASDEKEARWNYAFWLQNEFFCFGTEESAQTVNNWPAENGFPDYDDTVDVWDNEDIYEESQKITKAFVNVLISIVKEIHEQKILTQKFGKEIPILIHELEYYDEIAQQNIEANGKELVKDFTDFCLCN